MALLRVGSGRRLEYGRAGRRRRAGRARVGVDRVLLHSFEGFLQQFLEILLGRRSTRRGHRTNSQCHFGHVKATAQKGSIVQVTHPANVPLRRTNRALGPPLGYAANAVVLLDIASAIPDQTPGARDGERRSPWRAPVALRHATPVRRSQDWPRVRRGAPARLRNSSNSTRTALFSGRRSRARRRATGFRNRVQRR